MNFCIKLGVFLFVTTLLVQIGVAFLEQGTKNIVNHRTMVIESHLR